MTDRQAGNRQTARLDLEELPEMRTVLLVPQALVVTALSLPDAGKRRVPRHPEERSTGGVRNATRRAQALAWWYWPRS